MAAPKAKATVKDSPVVADLKTAVEGVQAGVADVQDDTVSGVDPAPLGDEERKDALANLLGQAAVAPPVEKVVVEQVVEPVVQADGLVSAIVLFDRFQYNPGTGWVNARAGDTIRLPEDQATRGIRLRGLKANA